MLCKVRAVSGSAEREWENIFRYRAHCHCVRQTLTLSVSVLYSSLRKLRIIKQLGYAYLNEYPYHIIIRINIVAGWLRCDIPDNYLGILEAKNSTADAG